MALGLGSDGKVKLLGQVPFFAGLSKKELEQVATIADELDFPAGKVLIREGDRGREFFVLVEGTVEITRGGETLDTRDAPEFFGEIALVVDRPRVATVTTVTPTLALVLTDRAFKSLLQRSPEIALKVLQAVGERLPPDEH